MKRIRLITKANKLYMFIEWIALTNTSIILTRADIHSPRLLHFHIDLSAEEVGQLLGGN